MQPKVIPLPRRRPYVVGRSQKDRETGARQTVVIDLAAYRRQRMMRAVPQPSGAA